METSLEMIKEDLARARKIAEGYKPGREGVDFKLMTEIGCDSSDKLLKKLMEEDETKFMGYIKDALEIGGESLDVGEDIGGREYTSDRGAGRPCRIKTTADAKRCLDYALVASALFEFAYKGLRLIKERMIELHKSGTPREGLKSYLLPLGRLVVDPADIHSVEAEVGFGLRKYADGLSGVAYDKARTLLRAKHGK